MRFRLIVLSVILLLVSPTVSSKWIPFNSGAVPGMDAAVDVRSSNLAGTSLTVTIPGMNVSLQKQDDREFDIVSIPGSGILAEPGNPLVPALRKFVAVPHGASVELTVRVRDASTLDEYNLWPAQPQYKRGDPRPPFTMNEMLYSESGWYPAQIARITDDMVMRDFRVILLEITPVRFDPAARTIHVATRIEIELTTSGGTGFGPGFVFPSFHAVYNRNILNYRSLNIQKRSDPEPMLLIAYDAALAELNSLVDWKVRRGLAVTVAPTSETGTSSANVFAYIQNVYDTWNPKPVYILLVGDSPQINPLYGIGSCASDYKFTLLAGSDIVPDVFISRISAQNSTQLGPQLDKILTYETNPEAGGWLDHITGISSSDSGPMGINDDERLDEIADRWQTHNPDCLVDRLYDSNGQGTTANISSAVNDGRFWISYYGHGSGSSWSSPYFNNSHVDALVNGHRTPFVMDVSCDNGGFAGSSDCFAEHWMKGGYGTDPHGAVAMYSSSTSTSWDPSAILGWGVCFAVCGDAAGTMPGGRFRLGEMTFDGMMYLVQEIGSGSDAQEVMQQYVLFGDCSSFMRSDAAITPTVTHMLTAPMAPMPFPVQVSSGGNPVADAVVCAYKTGDFQVVETTDASGGAILDLSPTSIGDMIITVSGQNLMPYQALVTIAPAGCGVIVLDRAQYNCSDIVSIMVSDSDLNLNPGALDTALADIASDSETVPETVILTETGPDSSIFIGTILTSDTDPGPGFLLLSHGDIITAHYQDADCNGEMEDVYDTASADCQSPVISSVTIAHLSPDTAVITWTTDEHADSAVVWGETPPPGNEVSDETLTTEHEITLDGLAQCTGYFFMVTSTDEGGNTAVDDNGGSYYFFMTHEQVIMLEENMDTDPGWSVQNQWAWGDPTGQGGQYGNPDPDTGYTGNNVVGYNLNGDYPNNMSTTAYLTTESFDCTDATEVNLRFWCWLGVERSIYDHANIEISNNGGSTWQTVWSNSETRDGGTWELWEFDISTFATGYSDVRIRWGIGPTDSGWTYCGWNIDDVIVDYVTECTEPTPTQAPTHTPTVIPTATPVDPTNTPIPTFTSPPPTATPAPPTATPVDPTATPIPTFTSPPPTATPAPPTATPAPPTATPVDPTATQSPNPETGMELMMADLVLEAGDAFYLHMYLHNPDSGSYDCDAYILLGLFGNFWCWPSWIDVYQGIDSVRYTVPAAFSYHEDILRFTWPAGVGASAGCTFIGAAFEPETWNLIGDIQVLNWEYR
ncbi:hypothetical protein JXA40_05550 [bacterium]|nr:hypothetical protein [candidate division CSSED10-310 bacterium]